MRTIRHTLAPIGLFVPTAFLLFGCGSGGPVTPPDDHEAPTVSHALLRIASGDGLVDTIDALAPLVIVVRDSTGAAPIRQTMVFRTSWVALGGDSVNALQIEGTRKGALHMSIPSDSFTVSARLGEQPTIASVYIEVPSLGLTDTARVTIRPGAPHKLTLEPADTAMFVDRSYPLRLSLTDRRAHALPDQVTVEASGAVSLDGAVVRGAAIGQGRIIAHAGSVADTATASVVPAARMAALWPARDSGQRPKVVILNLDGSDFEVLFQGTADFQSIQPDLSPVDDRVVFGVAPAALVGEDDPGGLYIAAPGEPAKLLLRAQVENTFEDMYAPRFAPDGEWIYFTAVTQHQTAEIWKIRADGSGSSTLWMGNG